MLPPLLNDNGIVGTTAHLLIPIGIHVAVHGKALRKLPSPPHRLGFGL